MGWFTSAYKLLSHGTPNWDTQLRTDMQLLETNLDQSGWVPAWGGGSGATTGTSGGTNGSVTRAGQQVIYAGRVLFGSSAAWGGAAVGACNLYGTNNTQLSFGFGYVQDGQTGQQTPVDLLPVSTSDFKVRIKQGGYYADFTGSPTQSTQLFFRIFCFLS